MKNEIVAVADLCVDLLFTGDVKPIYGQVEQLVSNYTLDLGGSAAIFSSQFTKLGGRVHLIGTVGNDVFGNYLMDRMRELNIAPTHIKKSKEIKTAVGLGLSCRNDRAMLTYSGTMTDVSSTDILATGLLDRTNHLHIASYYLLNQLHDFWIEQLPKMKSRGATISLDTNWSPIGDWQAVHTILPFIDVFLPNEQEALYISGQASVIDAGNWLSNRCGLTAIKLGGEGVMVFGKNGKFNSHEIPSYLKQDLKIADTTGAGDNFDAGFLNTWLSGKDLQDCVLDGMICGTLSLTQVGGIAGQPRDVDSIRSKIEITK